MNVDSVDACNTLMIVLAVMFLIAAVGFTEHAFHVPQTEHFIYMILCYSTSAILFIVVLGWYVKRKCV